MSYFINFLTTHSTQKGARHDTPACLDFGNFTAQPQTSDGGRNFCHCQGEDAGIARGTVYRNLKLMEQAREIARLEMPDGPDRFDKTSNPHGHLYCDCCGSLQDLPVIGLVREIENAIGTEVRSYQLTIHYICPECREKQAEL